MRNLWINTVWGLGALIFLSGCNDRQPGETRTGQEEEALFTPALDVNIWNSASTYVNLKSQAQVDAFACDAAVLDANLVIGDVAGSDIRDLSKLGCLVRISGFLQIHGTQLNDLTGLQNLRTVRAGIQIDQNAQLSSLRGLGSLDSLGGYLFVANNRQLADFSGLGPLAHIDALAVFENASLQSLAGLENVRTIGHDQEQFINLHIASNASLQSLQGLGQLFQVRGGLWITDNAKLSSLGALQMLDDVTGSVVLRKNGALKDSEGKPWMNKQIR